MSEIDWTKADHDARCDRTHELQADFEGVRCNWLVNGKELNDMTLSEAVEKTSKMMDGGYSRYGVLIEKESPLTFEISGDYWIEHLIKKD